MNELVPQLDYKNLYDVNPYRTLFEIHNDGAYISHTLTGTSWIKLLEDNTLTSFFTTNTGCTINFSNIIMRKK
jgi:hypothetical protein